MYGKITDLTARIRKVAPAGKSSHCMILFTSRNFLASEKMPDRLMSVLKDIVSFINLIKARGFVLLFEVRGANLRLFFDIFNFVFKYGTLRNKLISIHSSCYNNLNLFISDWQKKISAFPLLYLTRKLNENFMSDIVQHLSSLQSE